jgi:hypothetical protein
MSNSTRTPMKLRGLVAPLAQYAADNGKLHHPEAGRVLACPECDAADVRLDSRSLRCGTCAEQLDLDEIVDREKHPNAGGMDAPARALLRAPKDTPVDELSELEVDR